MTRSHLAGAVALASLLLATPSQAALIQVTITGLTDNTFVGSGDPCGTGLTGGNACNSKTIVISAVVDTGAAPADSDAATGIGRYRTVISPGFISGSATIDGRLFTLPVATNVDHTIDIYDNVNGGSFGILDRVQFALVGAGSGVEFTATPNVIMTSAAFSGESLDLLAGVVGSPVLVSGQPSFGNGSFNFVNATGAVLGQYRLSAVSFASAVVPAPPALWLLGTAVAGLVARRWRAGRGRA